jgi:hypothetical protein
MELLYNKPVVCPIVIGCTAELTTLHRLIDQARGENWQIAAGGRVSPFALVGTAHGARLVGHDHDFYSCNEK